MKAVLPLLCLLLPSTVHAGKIAFRPAAPRYDFKVGDIVFQATASRQCDAIVAATGSPYSHCGVVFSSAGRLYVLEAFGTVRTVPLEEFVKRSLPGTFHARRLKNAEAIFTPAVLEKAAAWAEANLGKPYDPFFLWGDKNLYCSELVWKIYRAAANLELTKPRPYGSFNLDPPIVRELIAARFGSIGNFPAKEPVVAPSDLASSPLLVEVDRTRAKKFR